LAGISTTALALLKDSGVADRDLDSSIKSVDGETVEQFLETKMPGKTW
jgi:hypothetical protein